MMPLVSIITITYNRGTLIHRCIESIQHQTYSNYEHIIVDGNSDDNTEDVVLSYHDPHIKFIKLDTRGPQLQMRAGADVARGDYVTFLDDDDEYLPTKIQKQVALFESLSNDYGLVYCWMTYFNYSNPDYPIKIHQTELRGFVGDIAVSKELVCGTPTLMIRRSVFEEFGGSYDDTHGVIGSDWELASRICHRYSVDYVPESLVKVYVNHGFGRLSETSLNREYLTNQIRFHLHFLDEFKEVFERHPEFSAIHLQMISKNNMMLGNWKEGFKYYWQLIRYRLDFKTCALIPYVIILKLKMQWTSKY